MIKHFYFFLILIVTIPFLTKAQINSTNPDTIAINEGIALEKNLGELTLYDYGQTLMKMKFFKYELSIGNLYGSRISLSTPTSLYDIYKNPETTIQLTLDQTESFINKLYYLLQIDSIKDTKLHRDTHLRSGKSYDAGTSIWRENKQYSFIVSNDQGGSINFSLEASDKEELIGESHIEGFLFSASNYNYFTVNNYNDYRKRVNKAIDRFRSLIRAVKNDEGTITNENEAGTRGQLISYEPFIQNGYQVLKSNVHNTDNINIVADIVLERVPRKIKISDYNNQFDSYEIITDDQFTMYARERLDYRVFVDELLQLLKEHNAKGILDPHIAKQDDSIKASFSLFK